LSCEVNAPLARHSDKGLHKSPPGEAWQERRVCPGDPAQRADRLALPKTRAGLRPGCSIPGLANADAPMNEVARQLRAQIPSSTDPQRLERMAREAERQAAERQRQAHGKLRSLPRSAEDIDTIV